MVPQGIQGAGLVDTVGVVLIAQELEGAQEVACLVEDVTTPWGALACHGLGCSGEVACWGVHACWEGVHGVAEHVASMKVLLGPWGGFDVAAMLRNAGSGRTRAEKSAKRTDGCGINLGRAVLAVRAAKLCR